ncbi:MAG: AhpC/TSA family protein [Clostridium sp.]|nr:AhpC/TSA family protein [Clostridium sp.]
MNKIVCTFFSLLLFSANAASALDYVVEGEIAGYDGKMLYLRDYDDEMKIDSTIVSNGKFKFQGSYPRPAFVRLDGGRMYANCVLDSLVAVDFNTHIPSSGTSLTMNFLDLASKLSELDNELDKFGEELQAHGFEQPELGDIYKHLYDKLRPQRLKLLYDAIENNSNGIGEYAIMELGGFWGLTPEEWEIAASKISPYLSERRLFGYFNKKYCSLRNSMPGRPFIDFSAKTVHGKDVKLSDYAGKGKYVLIDFWASWCVPCREEAEQTLRPLYEKYKDDGRFMILGVATWDSHDKTISALEKLNYPWPQIIDAGETPMNIYGFNAIPMIILISPDGTILRRDLRGDTLLNAVDSELNQGL